MSKLLIQNFNSRFIKNEPVKIVLTEYVDGHTAIELQATQPIMGERLAVATVNIPEYPLEPGQVILKTWSENVGIPEALMEAGIVGPVLARVRAGFGEATVHQLLVAAED